MQVTFKLLFDFEDLLTALEDLSQETTDKLILLNQQSILLQCYFLLLRNHDKMCNICSWNSPSRVNEGKSRFIIRTYWFLKKSKHLFKALWIMIDFSIFSFWFDLTCVLVQCHFAQCFLASSSSPPPPVVQWLPHPHHPDGEVTMGLEEPRAS